MGGIDRLLSKSLDATIRDNLGDKAIQKIENRLFEKYGISLMQSIEQFQKLDVVLREFFGSGADGLERKFLQNICDVKVVNGLNFISIGNPNLTKIILESFGDDDKKKILSTLSEHTLITSQIIEKCSIPQTSGYRKVNSLIDVGLLVPSGYVTTNDGKKVIKYRSVFDNLKIDIVKNKVTVGVNLVKEDFDESSVLSVCTQA